MLCVIIQGSRFQRIFEGATDEYYTGYEQLTGEEDIPSKSRGKKGKSMS